VFAAIEVAANAPETDHCGTARDPAHVFSKHGTNTESKQDKRTLLRLQCSQALVERSQLLLEHHIQGIWGTRSQGSALVAISVSLILHLISVI